MPVSIAAVSTWSHNLGGVRGVQRFVLFGSNAPSDPGWNVNDRQTFTPIAEVDTADTAPGKFSRSRIRCAGKPSLGTFRWLVWCVSPATGKAENTAYQELQVTPAP